MSTPGQADHFRPGQILLKAHLIHSLFNNLLVDIEFAFTTDSLGESELPILNIEFIKLFNSK